MDNYGGGSRLTSMDRENASQSVLLPSIGNPYKNRNDKQYSTTIQANGPIKALASERVSYHNLL